jgi:lipopolysaccharide/colanic/teichoic acid biosynthesis glycosyltransferase
LVGSDIASGPYPVQVRGTVLRIRSGVSEPIPYRVPKKLLDKVVAVGLLVVLSPVYAIAAGATAVDSIFVRRDRGPLVYRERRVSAGREFDLLKFRVLRREALTRIDAEGVHARLLEADAENLTWAGRRVLKPWYLDELPQLVNVLRGQMSLVGPRPWPVPMVADQVARGLDYRNHVVAGWTGPAQVEKGVTEPAGYSVLDVEYVEACRTASSAGLLRLDLRILGRTFKVLARGEGLRF